MSDSRIPRHVSDLRGGARLAVDATSAIADLAEALHAAIARPFAGQAEEAGRTRGLTGFVYRSVRVIARLSGSGVDAALGTLARALAPGGDTSGAERDAILSALNGVMGDHLAASGNPLALTMGLRHAGQPVLLQRDALAAAFARRTGKLLVLVHGLCMNDRQWLRDGHDHGAALARDLGYTPLYLRYNTGRPIAENGAEFARLLDTLVEQWPGALRELAVVAHSMGGLVTRSALHQAQSLGMAWPQRLDRVAFLGTPHAGAPLERGGHGIEMLLGISRYSAPFAKLARLRSAGITDLRHGTVLPAGAEPPLPLPGSVVFHALAASTADAPASPERGLRRRLHDGLVGDGLVPVGSALGELDNSAGPVLFAPERRHLLYGTNHMALLGRPAVYEVLRECLGERFDRG